MKIYLAALLWSCCMCGLSAEARTFYVRPGGNDTASGLYISAAWKTIAKVNTIDFEAGDTLLFEGGNTFAGNIYLSEEDSATLGSPLLISSYGGSRATIYASGSFGLYAYNVGTIHIDNIDFKGQGADSSTGSGIFFFTDNPTGKKYKDIRFSNLDVSGFRTGIQLGSWHSACPGYSRISVTHVSATDNLEDGFNTYDKAERTSSLLAHDSLQMSYCYFGNNGHSGLVLGGISGAMVERVKVSGTGHLHREGVVGIWTWNARNVIIQHCIVDSTITDGGDGGGFDIDGGTENCIIQYCYSFFNDGPGYMHCDYPQSRATKNNTIRYNISEYDGQQAGRDKASLYFISWGPGLENCIMHNNTSRIGDKVSGTVSGIQGFILDGYDTAPHLYHCAAVNNIISAAGDSNYMAFLHHGAAFHIDTTALHLAYNNYAATSGAAARWNDGYVNYYSLVDWQAAVYQDTYWGNRTGSETDPRLQAPGTGASVLFRQVDSLELLLQGYRLKAASPLIDSGMNMGFVFSSGIGAADFFGGDPLSGGRQDMGCHEFLSLAGLQGQAGLRGTVFPNPFKDEICIQSGVSPAVLTYILYNGSGQRVLSGTLSGNNNHIGTSALLPGIYWLFLGEGSAGFTLMKE